MNDKKKMVLVTHNGSFHADDVFAYVILKGLFPEHKLIRSRNKEDWKKGDIVFDVGEGEFDHHSVKKVYRKNGIPYASFGLIWKEYGRQYLNAWLNSYEFWLAYGRQYLGDWFGSNQLEQVYEKIDTDFIQAIDAFDNGVNLIQDTSIKINTVSDIIGTFNNLVESKKGLTPEMIAKNQDNYFMEASQLAKQLLENEVIGILNHLRAIETVQKAFEERTNKALVILNEGCPWEETLWELDKNEEVLYVVYPKPDGHYIQVMRKNKTTFDARKDLPESWAGKRDNELGELIGITDAIFCHSARFLAGAKSKESILKMAEIALNE